MPPAITAILTPLRDQLNLTSQALIFLLGVVGIGRIGGLAPALLAGVFSALLLNYYFVPPIHQLSIANLNNVIALVVFVLMALTVASVVDIAVRQTRRAAHASVEAQILSVLAGSVLRGEEAIPALVQRSRETFAISSVTLLGRIDADIRPDGMPSDNPQQWMTLGSAGAPAARCPSEADVTVPVGQDAVLALRGWLLPAADQRVLTAFGAQVAVAVALNRDRLTRQAARAKPAVEADQMHGAAGRGRP
jgi:two-component system sensor histidine kinase KdpD